MNSVWRLQDQKSCFDAMVVMALSGRSNRTFLPTSPHEQPINKEVVFCYRWYTEEVVKVLSVQYLALVQNRGDVVLPRVTLARIMDQWAFSLSSRVDIHLSDHYFSYLHIKVGSECRFVFGNDGLWFLWRGTDGKGSSDDDAIVVALVSMKLL